MKKELKYFTIDGALGWNQNWFKDKSMYLGGCGAVTACDLCIYLAREKGFSSLYPYDENQLNKQEYVEFSKIMKKYLAPRWTGIDTLEIYIKGFSNYLGDIGESSLKVEGLSASVAWEEGKKLIKDQIDSGMIVPFLLLNHKSHALKDYQWHWFNLAGYEEFNGEFHVEAITYGSFRWLNLQELWDTGYKKKGGIIKIYD